MTPALPISTLIVDDNEADRYLLARLLKRAGLCEEVFEAGDGREALEFLSRRAENEKRYPDRFPPILVFCDINMPRMNGIAFLEGFKELQDEQTDASIVFMMFTSSTHPDERARAEAFPFVRGFITKMPESADDLRATILRAFEDL